MGELKKPWKIVGRGMAFPFSSRGLWSPFGLGRSGRLSAITMEDPGGCRNLSNNFVNIPNTWNQWFWTSLVRYTCKITDKMTLHIVIIVYSIWKNWFVNFHKQVRILGKKLEYDDIFTCFGIFFKSENIYIIKSKWKELTLMRYGGCS